MAKAAKTLPPQDPLTAGRRALHKRRNAAQDRRDALGLLGRVVVLAAAAWVLFTQVFLLTQASGNCWVSVKQFSKNDTATACQDWLRSTRLGRGSIKSHVRTVKVLGMGLFAFQERIHLWKGVTH